MYSPGLSGHGISADQAIVCAWARYSEQHVFLEPASTDLDPVTITLDAGPGSLASGKNTGPPQPPLPHWNGFNPKHQRGRRRGGSSDHPKLRQNTQSEGLTGAIEGERFMRSSMRPPRALSFRPDDPSARLKRLAASRVADPEVVSTRVRRG